MVLVVKNIPINAKDIRDGGWIPGLGRSPGEKPGSPLQSFCLENPHGRGAWWVPLSLSQCHINSSVYFLNLPQRTHELSPPIGTQSHLSLLLILGDAWICPSTVSIYPLCDPPLAPSLTPPHQLLNYSFSPSLVFH